MTAAIKVAGQTAILSRGGWTCANPILEKMLTSRLDIDRQEISGSDPNPERTIAQKAADFFKGELISADRPAFDPEVVY